MMAARTNADQNHHTTLSHKQTHREKAPVQHPKSKSFHTKDNQTQCTESVPSNRIDIHGPEVMLLPDDEQECRQIYEKLQRLQPDGACVDLNTLRRALYPPIRTTTYQPNLNHEQISAFKAYRRR